MVKGYWDTHSYVIAGLTRNLWERLRTYTVIVGGPGQARDDAVVGMYGEELF